MDRRRASADRGLTDAAGTVGQRRVLLGASNLLALLPDALARAAELDPPATPVFVALGHGRSYGLTSRFLGRELPSIRDCGIWAALEKPGPGGRALVTDVGNDLGYGVDAATLLAWVDDVVARLGELGFETTLVGVPGEALEARTDLELAVARRVFFPTSELTVAGIRAGVDELAGGLPELAARRGARFVTPDPGWYGLDPIHVRRRCQAEVLDTFLGVADAHRPGGADAGRPPGPLERLRCRVWAPLERRIFGAPAGARQPVGRFRGRAVALY